MRNVSDSFVMFLIDNLEPTYIINHLVNTEKDHPDSSNLQINAINVEFLGINFDRHINEQFLSLDIVYDSEYTGMAALEAVYDLLSKQFFIPQKNYTNPSSPQSVDGSIYWDEDAIRFRRIPSPSYFHQNSTFFLKFYRTLN